MKLVDFTQDESLNRLRDRMGADQLGQFELFDPELHLSWQDKQNLAKDWIIINANRLHAGHEHALYFKNSPVVAKVGSELHFALCDDLKKQISQGLLADLPITTGQDKLSVAKTCPYCLHAVAYEGFDVYRHRHQEYNDKILKSFNLVKYLQERWI